MPVKPIPEGYHSITPYLIAEGATKLIDFLKTAFGAVELHRTMHPNGTVMHAEYQIGDSRVMLSEGQGEWKPMPAAIYLYVPDVDDVHKRAIQAGATSIMEPSDQFYGDRNGGVKDPSGNLWFIATHVEDISIEELRRRSAAKQAHGG